MIDALYSDQFLFWSVIFIFSVFLGSFIYGFFGRYLKNFNEDIITCFVVFAGIDIATIIFYIAGAAEGTRNKSDEVFICFMDAMFIGTICMVTPVCIGIVILISKIFTLFGAILGVMFAFCKKKMLSYIFMKKL